LVDVAPPIPASRTPIGTQWRHQFRRSNRYHFPGYNQLAR
jgi:hypothetical protein